MNRLVWRVAARVAARPQLVAIALLLVAVVAVSMPGVAEARAGGGNHSSGGSSSSGSSGSSSGLGGLGSGLFFLPFLGGGGIVGFLILMFVLSMIRKGGGGSGLSGQPPVVPYLPTGQQYGPTGQALGTEGLAEIKANDPGFNEEQFLDRSHAAFFLLQTAWQDRNVDEGRAYMSGGLYTSWSAQVAAMVAAHKKNVLENLFVEGKHIVRATHDDNFDMITVRFDARATDSEVDDTTGKKVFGDKSDESFTEYWTFQRSAGAKTLVGGGVTEKKCPNCGAPLEVNQNGACKYCDAAVTSGKFDWVLSKIDQANEWS